MIVIDGVVSNDLGIKEDSELWGVSSTSIGRDQLDNSSIQRIQQGVVTGIAGYLIAEGERRGLDVTALLAECNPMYPDARAALIAVEGLSELVGIEVPVEGLLEDARNIEERVREAFEKAHSNALPAPGSDDDEDDVPMYLSIEWISTSIMVCQIDNCRDFGNSLGNHYLNPLLQGYIHHAAALATPSKGNHSLTIINTYEINVTTMRRDEWIHLTFYYLCN